MHIETTTADLPEIVPSGRELSVPFGRELVATALAIAAILGTYFLPESLDPRGRITLAVTVLSIIGWTLTRIPDVVVAVIAAILLVIFDCLPVNALESALGHPMIWLMLCAFIIAAALSASGTAERLAIDATRPFRTVRGLFYGVTGVIFLTAFAIPSTSGRAALLLPVFLALVTRLPDPRLHRPFALLFPTIILLSAGASLIGAGAHVIAAETISQATGQAIGMVGWSILTLPFSVLICLAAVELILWIFASTKLRKMPIAAASNPSAPLTVRQTTLALILVGTIGLWIATPLHGLSLTTVALIGVVATLSIPIPDVKTKELFRKVNVELLVFVSATMVLAQAMRHTGADAWLAATLLESMPAKFSSSSLMIFTLAAAVALLFHLAVTSRSARAAVLFPALGLPLASLGHDMAVLALIIILGTGFCQTLPASAKPVALFSSLENPVFNRVDLMKLACVLAPFMFALLILFAVAVWPHQIAALRSAS